MAKNDPIKVKIIRHYEDEDNQHYLVVQYPVREISKGVHQYANKFIPIGSSDPSKNEDLAKGKEIEILPA